MGRKGLKVKLQVLLQCTSFAQVPYILLITKWYIHNCKCNVVFPNIRGLLSKILDIEHIEYNIACSKDNKALAKHEKKWLNLKDLGIEDTVT